MRNSSEAIIENKTFETPESVFVSQYKLGLPQAVQRCSCAIACAETMYKVLSKQETDKTAFARTFIEWGEYTKPVVNVTFGDENGIHYPVMTVKDGVDEALALQEANSIVSAYSNGAYDFDRYRLSIKKPGEIYRPTFTMKDGTDSRGMMLWFRSLGFEASLYEYNNTQSPSARFEGHSIVPNVDDFFEIMKEDMGKENHMIMVSVLQAELKYPKSVDIIRTPGLPSTHLLTILRADRESLVYLDPIFLKPSEGVKVTNLEKLKQAMLPNGRKKAHFLTVSKK